MADDKELRDLYVYGTESFEKGNYIKAEALLNEVDRLNPNFADVHNKLGVIANLKGDLDVAESHFRRAIEINPDYTEAALNLTITLNERGKTEEASKIFDKGTDKATKGTVKLDRFASGKIANEHYRLGNIYLEFGMVEEAIDEYKKALRVRADLVDVQTKLGVALRDAGRKEEALAEFQKARTSNPKYGPARVQLALTLYVLGRQAEAVDELKSALADNPNLKMAENYLKFFTSRKA